MQCICMGKLLLQYIEMLEGVVFEKIRNCMMRGENSRASLALELTKRVISGSIRFVGICAVSSCTLYFESNEN